MSLFIKEKIRLLRDYELKYSDKRSTPTSNYKRLEKLFEGMTSDLLAELFSRYLDHYPVYKSMLFSRVAYWYDRDFGGFDPKEKIILNDSIFIERDGVMGNYSIVTGQELVQHHKDLLNLLGCTADSSLGRG